MIYILDNLVLKMPRRLEIRTTILEKKPSGRTKEKDANSNDVYVAEAMQLLEEIEQLKSNVCFLNYFPTIHDLTDDIQLL